MRRSLWPVRRSVLKGRELPLRISGRILGYSYGEERTLPSSLPQAQPVHLDIYNLITEEDQEVWTQSAKNKQLSVRYSAYLAAAAQGLYDSQGDQSRLLFVNLGPAWPEGFQTQWDNILEPANYAFERPPGLGIGPLSVLFTVCRAMHSWLTASIDNAVVLHCRGCSGTGLGLLYLVATCYLMYTTQFRHHFKALAALDPIRLQHVGGITDTSPARRDIGAAQQRYCSYFERALYILPPRVLRLVLRHVLVGSLDALVAKGGRKHGPLRHQSRLSQHLSQHSGVITGFEVGLPVAGDVTVGLFLGDHKRDWDAPTVAYAFNASFVQAGVIRLNAGDLDFPGTSVDPFAIDAAGFFMDLLFDELAADESAPLRTYSDDSLKSLRGGWLDTLEACGTDASALVRPADDSPLTAETAASLAADVTAVAMNQLGSGVLLSDCSSASPAGIAMAALTAAGEPATEGGERQATVIATMMPANGGQQESDVTEIMATSGQLDCKLVPSSQCDSNSARELPQAALAPLPSSETQQAANSPSSKPGQVSTPQAANSSFSKPGQGSIPKAPAAPPPPPPPPKRGSSGHSRAAPKPPSPMGTTGVTAPSSLETAHQCHSDANPSGAKPVAHVRSSSGGNSQSESISHDLLIGASSSGRLNLISQQVVTQVPSLRVLHWAKARSQPGSIWASLQPPQQLPAELHAALRRLFANQQPQGESPATAGRRPGETVRVISLTRATNIAIMLTRFAAFSSLDELLAEVCSLSSGVTVDQLMLLMQIAPAEGELASLADWIAEHRDVGQLSRSERYLWALGQLPRLKAKLAVLVFRSQCQPLLQDAQAALHTIQQACQQIASSKRLREVLEAVLAVGNALNQGTAFANTQAVRIESLLRLSDLRAHVASEQKKHGNGDSLPATDNTAEQRSRGLSSKESKVQNLLHFVALLLAARGKLSGSSGWLSEELSLVNLAARKARGDLKESLLALDAGLAAATAELAAISIPDPGNGLNEPQSSHIMEEQFSAALQPFVKTLRQDHVKLKGLVGIVDAQLAQVATYLGEPAAVDMPTVLLNLGTFASRMDGALQSMECYLHVASVTA